MLFKRQKVLLTLLDALGGTVAPLDFQKLLFFFMQETEDEPLYEFVPYHFGGFSFTSYGDKRKLIEKGLLEDDDQRWSLTEAGRETARNKATDHVRALSFSRRYAHLRGDALILAQYRQYPYYAIHSELLDTLPLKPEELQRISAARPEVRASGLLTIGYEGCSLENYLNKLLRAGATVLCDVRKNALSRKYGFSKGTLVKACDGVGIRYEHLSELGIESAERRNIATQKDYDGLFAAYERKTLVHQTTALTKILGWIAAGERVALTCYEHFPHQCHRTRVAHALQRMGLEQEVQHL